MNKAIVILLILILIIIPIHYFQIYPSSSDTKTEGYGVNLLQATHSLPSLPCKDLNEILLEYNSQLSYEKITDIPLKEYTYTRTNFDKDLRDLSSKVVNCILHTINKYNNSKYEFTDLEVIKEYKYSDKTLVEVELFVHQRVLYSTHLLVLKYIYYPNKNIKIQNLISKTTSKEPYQMRTTSTASVCNDSSPFLKSILDTDIHCSTPIVSKYKDRTITVNLNWDNRIHPFWYNNQPHAEWVVKSGPLLKDLELLRDICYTQEPCKYELTQWNSQGVHKQIKLEPSCNISNHSSRILDPDPYINPTLFNPIY
jgi:hypothetical protein